jgi:Methyl-accepting chemotaxis protein (MCP) signalling domain
MREMDDSSDRMWRMIKVIDEIGFQTNILALNAAVEAATTVDPSEQGTKQTAGQAESRASTTEQLAGQTQSLYRLIERVRSQVVEASNAGVRARHPHGNGHSANQPETGVARLAQAPAKSEAALWPRSFPLEDGGRGA